MNTDLPVPEQISAMSGNGPWHGALEGMHDRLVFGWAFNSACPDARVVIELCLDGVPCACIAADAARTDLATTLSALAGRADVCHGFIADLNALAAHAHGILTARVANTDVVLPGSMDIAHIRKPPPAALNSVVGDGGLRLFGWAIDPSDPHRTRTVRAFLGHEMVAQAAANIVLPLSRAYVDGPHGFDLALPISLADGRTHTLRVVDDEGHALNGSPVIVCCMPAGLAALLPEDTDELTLRVAATYERMVPRSLPLSAWPEWSARFDHASSKDVPTSLAPLRLGILVTGTQDAAATARTAESLERQGRTTQLYSGLPFPSMLAEALAAGCEVITCIRAGDTLGQYALVHALAGFTSDDVEVVYTDSEHEGRPWFKPAWDPDYALGSDCALEFLLVRSSVARRLPPLANEAEFAWASLSEVWTRSDEAIVHVPRVLYQVNSPLTPGECANRAVAAARAIKAHEPAISLEELAGPLPGAFGAARRVRPALPADASDVVVSLIIPTRDRADLLKRCIDSIQRFTTWRRLEILIIDNGSTESSTHAYFADIATRGIRVLPMPGPFNYADLNNRAVTQASGEIIGLVNNDIEALHEGWLDEIIAQLMRPGVGAVGAKLLWPNGMVQHGGVVLGVGDVAGHFGNRLMDADWGDHGRNQLVQRVSACTAACLFLRKQDFIAVGGMDAHAFPVAFNDVDLCLKLRAAGKTIIWTPHAKLLHAESASRGHEDTPQKKARAQREIDMLRQRWGHVLSRDPAYHPAVNLDPNGHAFGGFALPPRSRRPRTNALPSIPELS
ncbi:glycosyltransferase family 2 protein [Pseudoduganella lutea]|nr:glycosyltransferase [Pseudoduganella lutea]